MKTFQEFINEAEYPRMPHGIKPSHIGYAPKPLKNSADAFVKAFNNIKDYVQHGEKIKHSVADHDRAEVEHRIRKHSLTWNDDNTVTVHQK